MILPRAWTLAFDGHYTNAALDGDYDQPNGVGDESIWVAELEPVLDILEPLLLAARNSGRLATHELLPAAAFLQAHGRWQLNSDGSLKADG